MGVTSMTASKDALQQVWSCCCCCCCSANRLLNQLARRVCFTGCRLILCCQTVTKLDETKEEAPACGGGGENNTDNSPTVCEGCAPTTVSVCQTCAVRTVCQFWLPVRD